MGTIGQVDHRSTPLWRYPGQYFPYAIAEGQSLSALVMLLPSPTFLPWRKEAGSAGWRYG
jgi:hypothetical protein